MFTMASRLRAAREMAGFKSARAAAEALGITVSTYGAHENGQNRFDLKSAKEYAAAFDVPYWVIVDDPTRHEEREIVGSFASVGEAYASKGAELESAMRLVESRLERARRHGEEWEKRDVREMGAEASEASAKKSPAKKTVFAEFSSSADHSEIPEIDLVAGMGGGGLSSTSITSKNGITFSSENVRSSWVIPEWALQKMHVKANNVACFPCQGDSMEPSISDGDVVFIDTRHRVPSPPGIYALTDEFGGIVVKRLEVISGPKEELVRVRISSDNSRYLDKELNLDEIFIVGRYICRVAF